ncbi:TPA: restriction endonuclease subunit S [Klebsiella pneumoniae]
MSKLNYLEKLLEGIEVEWFPLGKVAKKIYSGGTPDTKKTEYWEHGTIPWMSSGEVNLKTIKETETFITEDGLNNSSAKFVPENSIVMALAGQGKTRGKVARTRIKLTTNQSLAAITFDERKINSDYIFHFLETQYDNLRQISSGNSGRGGLNLQMISAYKAPIPCPGDPEKSLAIQSEIVRILDKFTALTAELTAELNAELTMRKKQYNYYREQLMNLEEREDTREMSIGDIYDFQYGTGNTIPKSGGQYPVYGSNGIVGSHDKYNSEDSPVIGHIGAYAGIVNWGQGKHFVTYNGVICRHKSKEVLQKYAYHLLLLQDFGSKSNSASQPFVSYNILNAPIVWVPPLQEQARIVAILDKFDTLTSSITEGLPREIELRQKQYEYYRDLLFSFPKPEATSN